jgi:type I restriction enzyme, S subunit
MSKMPLHIPRDAARFPRQCHWIRLEDVSEGVFDCPHSTPQLADDGPYVVRSQDIRSGVFRTDLAAKVSNGTYEERIARAEPRYGDLVYSREGTYFGIAAEVPKNIMVCLGQRMVLIRPKAKVLNSRFLRLWLNSPIMFRHINGFRDGSVAERLNMPTIRGLPVPLLPLSEQNSVAGILGTIDDKIDLNRRMNETLEAMARAVFKSWFVDFDPVRARAAGRAPAHMPPEIAALFPDRFNDEGLPEGWEEKRIDDILELSYGKALKKADRVEGDVPVYGSGGVTGWHNQALVKGPSIIVGRKGTVGSLYWEDKPFYPIDTTFYVKSAVELTFCFYLLQGLGLDRMNTDAAVPGLNRNNAYRLPVPWSHSEIRKQFDGIVGPFRKTIRANHEQNQTLAELCDLLLPKLMSGEIRLVDAERAVGDPV